MINGYVDKAIAFNSPIQLEDGLLVKSEKNITVYMREYAIGYSILGKISTTTEVITTDGITNKGAVLKI